MGIVSAPLPLHWRRRLELRRQQQLCTSGRRNGSHHIRAVTRDAINLIPHTSLLHYTVLTQVDLSVLHTKNMGYTTFLLHLLRTYVCTHVRRRIGRSPFASISRLLRKRQTSSSSSSFFSSSPSSSHGQTPLLKQRKRWNWAQSLTRKKRERGKNRKSILVRTYSTHRIG